MTERRWTRFYRPVAFHTPHGSEVVRHIRSTLARDKATPIEHWEKVLSTPGLPDVSYEYARAAMTKLERRTRARVPGEDDGLEPAWDDRPQE